MNGVVEVVEVVKFGTGGVEGGKVGRSGLSFLAVLSPWHQVRGAGCGVQGGRCREEAEEGLLLPFFAGSPICSLQASPNRVGSGCREPPERWREGAVEKRESVR